MTGEWEPVSASRLGWRLEWAHATIETHWIMVTTLTRIRPAGLKFEVVTITILPTLHFGIRLEDHKRAHAIWSCLSVIYHTLPHALLLMCGLSHFTTYALVYVLSTTRILPHVLLLMFCLSHFISLIHVLLLMCGLYHTSPHALLLMCCLPHFATRALAYVCFQPHSLFDSHPIAVLMFDRIGTQCTTPKGWRLEYPYYNLRYNPWAPFIVQDFKYLIAFVRRWNFYKTFCTTYYIHPGYM